jgi:hypothetical protein
MNAYLDYAQGYNLTNRMPLWVKPTNALDLATVIKLMRDHFEGLSDVSVISLAHV